MRKEVRMLVKSSCFYHKESSKLLNKMKNLKTKKEKEDSLKELVYIRSKIKFEINQINKILKDEEPSSDFGSSD
jgi:hypothetical protein